MDKTSVMDQVWDKMQVPVRKTPSASASSAWKSSLVWSLAQIWKDKDRNWLLLVDRLEKTAHNWCRPVLDQFSVVLVSFWQSLDQLRLVWTSLRVVRRVQIMLFLIHKYILLHNVVPKIYGWPHFSSDLRSGLVFGLWASATGTRTGPKISCHMWNCNQTNKDQSLLVQLFKMDWLQPVPSFQPFFKQIYYYI